MTTCPLCQETAGFRVKLVDGQAMHTCNGCAGVIPAAQLADTAPASVPATRPQAQRDGPPPASAALTPGTLIASAKARVKEITALLRDMKKLEAERGELQRLIEAAKGKDAAGTVRRFIRTTDAATDARPGKLRSIGN